LALYNSVTIPINIAFNPPMLNSVGIAIFESLIDLCFFVDVIFNFRTTYISTKTGDEVKDPRQIAKKYILNGRLIVDVLSSIPFDKLARGTNNVLPMLGMLKLVRVGRVSVVIRNLNAKSDAKSCYKTMWLVFSLVLYIHVIGCLWYYVVSTDEVWIPQKDYIWPDSPYLYELYSADFSRRYFISLYTGVYLISSNEMCPATN
jgi:hypothetical protein